VPGRRLIASRATDRCISRAPTLEPNAMYATSRIPFADGDDLGVIERPVEGHMRLAHRHANSLHVTIAEDAVGDRAGELLQVQQLGRLERRADFGIQAPVVHDTRFLPDP